MLAPFLEDRGTIKANTYGPTLDGRLEQQHTPLCLGERKFFRDRAVRRRANAEGNMGTQHDGQELDFEFVHPQQLFRLLELPPDLLTLVTSDDPPTYATILPSVHRRMLT